MNLNCTEIQATESESALVLTPALREVALRFAAEPDFRRSLYQNPEEALARAEIIISLDDLRTIQSFLLTAPLWESPKRFVVPKGTWVGDGGSH